MDKAAHYLRQTLSEQDAARNSPTAELRREHEELAIAYELLCLMRPQSQIPNRR